MRVDVAIYAKHVPTLWASVPPAWAGGCCRCRSCLSPLMLLLDDYFFSSSSAAVDAGPAILLTSGGRCRLSFRCAIQPSCIDVGKGHRASEASLRPRPCLFCTAGRSINGLPVPYGEQVPVAPCQMRACNYGEPAHRALCWDFAQLARAPGTAVSFGLVQLAVARAQARIASAAAITAILREKRRETHEHQVGAGSSG